MLCFFQDCWNYWNCNWCLMNQTSTWIAGIFVWKDSIHAFRTFLLCFPSLFGHTLMSLLFINWFAISLSIMFSFFLQKQLQTLIRCLLMFPWQEVCNSLDAMDNISFTLTCCTHVSCSHCKFKFMWQSFFGIFCCSSIVLITKKKLREFNVVLPVIILIFYFDFWLILYFKKHCKTSYCLDHNDSQRIVFKYSLLMYIFSTLCFVNICLIGVGINITVLFSFFIFSVCLNFPGCELSFFKPVQFYLLFFSAVLCVFFHLLNHLRRSLSILDTGNCRHLVNVIADFVQIKIASKFSSFVFGAELFGKGKRFRSISVCVFGKIFQ